MLVHVWDNKLHFPWQQREEEGGNVACVSENTSAVMSGPNSRTRPAVLVLFRVSSSPEQVSDSTVCVKLMQKDSEQNLYSKLFN